MEITLCNNDHLRTIFIQAGEMVLFPRYHKTGHAMERDACQPGFGPEVLANLYVELYGGGLREAEALLTFFLYGAQAAEIQRT